MANVTLKYIIDLVAGQLQDADNDAWDEQELVNWANIGCRQIVSFVPAANIVVSSLKLAPGSLQRLGVKGVAVMDVIRNMGTDGQTPGPAITRTSLELLSAYLTSWPETSQDTEIANFATDPRIPTVFYVYPPADGTTYVEVARSEIPDAIVWDSNGNWETATVGISNEYVGALIDYILFRAFSKDADYPGNEQRALKHLKAYLQALGIAAEAEQQGGSQNG